MLSTWSRLSVGLSRGPLSRFQLFHTSHPTLDSESPPAPEKRKERSRDGDEPEEDFATDPMDRTRVIPLELSLKYMDSPAYTKTYGESKIWELYRRNIAHGRTDTPPRKKCIRHGKLTTANACPICRDEYLVVDYRNTKLLNQFLTEYNAQVLSAEATGVCRTQHMNLCVELEKAKDRGLLDVDPPFVEYDYAKYRPKEANSQ